VVTSAPVALTTRDRELIRASLLELSRGSRALVLAALGSPSSTSTANGWLRSTSNLESDFGGTLFNSACNSIALSVTAAADSAEAFVLALKSERSTVAMAALSRAATEAYARAYFLLNSQSETDFYHRYLSLTYEELRFPVRHSGFTTGDGMEIDGSAYRQEVADFAATLGLGTFLDVGLAGLVERVLDRIVEGRVDPAIYSQLSGVAHGTASAVGMFVGRSSSGWKLIFPRDIALEYAGYIYSAAVNVADLTVKVFAPTADLVDRWTGVRNRASIALSELRTSI
jgi:hypothetical protein